MDASAQFRQAITLTKNSDIDFSSSSAIDFTGTPGAADFVRLGTDGNVTYAGSAFSGPSTGTAGDVDISGATGDDVSISCTATATISDGTNTLTVDSLQYSMNTGDVFGSSDDTCDGLDTNPLTYTITGTSDKILLGGRIVGNSGTVASGTYSTATAGGTAATVRVVYQ